MKNLPNEKTSMWWLLAKAPLFLLIISVLLPYYWMSIGAFKTVPELVQNPPTFVVKDPTLQNFYDTGYVEGGENKGHWAGIFQRKSDGRTIVHYYFNTLCLTIFNVIVGLLLASLVAFVLTKRPFPGSNFLFNVLLLSMMVPFEAVIVPNFITVSKLGWLDTYQVMIFPGLAKAYVVFYFRQMMLSLSNDLVDAATIDGAGTFRIWWSIILPLTRPGLAAIGIPVAIGEWNSYIWPLLTINDADHMTLPLMLGKLAGNLMYDPQSGGVLMAASLLVSIPAIIAFLAFQKQFIDGLTAGASKG